jgi:hypothetical protein
MEVLAEDDLLGKTHKDGPSLTEKQESTDRLPGYFCSQHIFHVKTAGLTRFDRLETPLSASYHQAVAQ